MTRFMPSLSLPKLKHIGQIRSCLYILSTILLSLSAIQTASAIENDINTASTEDMIKQLDQALNRRNIYIAQRQSMIDSLKKRYSGQHEFQTLMEIGDAYSSFSNDSALSYFDRAIDAATSDDKLIAASLKRASLLPLAGFFDVAVKEYETIDTVLLKPEMMELYHESGRKLYSYISDAYADYRPYHTYYQDKALKHQQQLLVLLNKESIEYLFNLGEYYFLTGKRSKAKALLEDLLSKTDDKNLKARASHHLSAIARQQNKNDEYIYFLANSAISDIESATLEVISLQELGSAMYAEGDVDRAYSYLSAALDNAVKCAASLRMIESSRALPLISSTHNEQINTWRNTIYVIMIIMMILLIGLAVTLAMLYREMKHMRKLESRLRLVNSSKDIYISQFLKLCSIYMDKLNQFCKLTERKISAGKADELYRMTKSGKFIEEQSSEFYDVFDNAFLHLYPDFVEKVNMLLRPECQIESKDGETLNTDLRILAIMRMGIDDSASIAQILNYSINTIYSYRNRLKSRAIDKDNFEKDIMAIESAS